MSARLPAQERRDQLLGVAIDTFARQGFHSTSMNDIADAAGVTKPVLYQHFASKRRLYLELLDEVGQELRNAIGAAVSEQSDGEHQVLAGFRTYFAWVAKDPRRFTLVFGSGARRDEEFSEAVREIEFAIAAHVAQFIDVDLDEGHRIVLAHGLVGMAEGTCRYWVANDLDLDPELLARQVAELAWAGLRNVRRVE